MIEPDVLAQFDRLVVVAHAASTWTMVGVILVVQVVHYPLFSAVGPSHFAAYESLHTRRITWVVAPAMLVELATAVTLAFRPPASAIYLVWTGLALLAMIWISTMLVQVPLHRSLSAGFDPLLHRKLLATNWVRTVAWIARGVVAAILLLQYFSPSPGRP